MNIGIVRMDGTIIDRLRMTSVGANEIRKFVRNIFQKTEGLLAKHDLNLADVYFIGIGVPGTVDMEQGMVEYCPNLFWEMIPLQEIFQEFFRDKYIKVIQDSWAGALAEHEFGAGKAYENMACVTLGTGIGGGVILQNKIFQGGMHSAGEIGHIIVQKDGRTCNCGSHGCLEKYASGNGIYEQAAELFPEKFVGRTDNAETVFALAYEGDEEALDLINESVKMLAIGLANMVNILSLEAIVISGGLCEHTELIVKPLQKYINEYGYYAWTRQERFVLRCASLGSDAPMLGAAFIYKGLR